MKLCAYKFEHSGMNCVAEVAAHAPNGFCPPHEAMAFHDLALAFFRRKNRKGEREAELWAQSRGLDLTKIKEAAKVISKGSSPLLARSISEVDNL